MAEQTEHEKMKAILEHIYALRSEEPEENSLDGIAGHFLPDAMMKKIANVLGHTDYKEVECRD